MGIVNISGVVEMGQIIGEKRVSKTGTSPYTMYVPCREKSCL